MTFEGKITFISDQIEVGQNNLPKVTIILEENTDKDFKSSIAIDLLGEKTELIKTYKVGDTIKASLNFKANEFNGKRYNRISARKLEGSNGQSNTKQATQDDDLPF